MTVLHSALSMHKPRLSLTLMRWNFNHNGFPIDIRARSEQGILHVEIRVSCRPSFRMIAGVDRLWGFHFGLFPFEANFAAPLTLRVSDINQATLHFIAPHRRQHIEHYFFSHQDRFSSLRRLLVNRESLVERVWFKKDRIQTKEIMVDHPSFEPVVHDHLSLLSEMAGEFGHNPT